jgi:hypothetical protein
VLGQQAARERSDRERERRDPGPDPDRHPPLLGRARRRDDREGRRVHQRRAHALEDACRDQHLAGVGEPTPERREREDDDPDHEEEPAAVRVRELAADQHQRREAERVAGDDPLELGEVGAEVLLDRRQRDVHDGVVEHDHEEAEGDGGERPPLPVRL